MSEPEPILVTLGRSLRAVRVERGMSQEELHMETGVHRNYIGGIERAERNPTVTTVAKLANALGVSVDSLLSN